MYLCYLPTSSGASIVDLRSGSSYPIRFGYMGKTIESELGGARTSEDTIPYNLPPGY